MASASTFIVRPAKRSDCPAIIALKKEMPVHHQDMRDKPMLSVQGLIHVETFKKKEHTPPTIKTVLISYTKSNLDLERDGFDTDPPCFHCIVAENLLSPSSSEESPAAEESSKVIGFALYFYGYAAFEGKVLHLEDLCTAYSFRGTGVGSALIKRLAKVFEWNRPKFTSQTMHSSIRTIA
jgi:hypothetical protein